jgi:hypothetical protein
MLKRFAVHALVIGFIFATSLSAGEITLNHGGDCAPTMDSLIKVHAARLKYYGTDDPAYQPPDTEVAYQNWVKVADLQDRLNVFTLGKTTVTLVEMTNLPTILKVLLKSKRGAYKVCYVWTADGKR